MVGVSSAIVSVAWIIPTAYVSLLCIGMLIAGVLMPLMHVVPFAHQDSDDIVLAVVLFLVFGPLSGGFAYVVLCVMRSSGSPTIVGIFISYLLVRVPIDIVTSHPWNFSSFLPFTGVSAGESWLQHLVAQYSILVGLVGWYAADSFRSLDD